MIFPVQIHFTYRTFLKTRMKILFSELAYLHHNKNSIINSDI